ncbi:MAG: AAA family ATPase [Catenulispora sp.]|nr:AAA family ATPase [Catenulispora sp.]
MPDWQIYTGSRVRHDGIDRLPKPPPWRTFAGGPPLPIPAGDSGQEHSARRYRPSPDAVRHVNAALYLRRPLLVTGPPGTGKSTLAYAVAHELGLGPVLHWPITSRVVLRDGLYEYDPLTRLYAAGRWGLRSLARPAAAIADDIGDYIRLGPLGTALLPHLRPRVLLIDEIDKSDVDLPNDLLTIFEKGSFEIVELARRADPTARVMTADRVTAARVPIRNGTVTCRAFPLIVMTSNGEREFPPAFLRRCVTVELKQTADTDELEAIVAGHLSGVLNGGAQDEQESPALPEHTRQIIERFLQRQGSGMLANDQLLNAVYLCHHALVNGDPESILELADQVMPYLSPETGSDVR